MPTNKGYGSFPLKVSQKYTEVNYERNSNNKQTWNHAREQTDAIHGYSNDSLNDAASSLQHR